MAAATRDHMLVRRAGVVSGSVDWAASSVSDWDVLDSSLQAGVIGSRTWSSECAWFDVGVYACIYQERVKGVYLG